MRYQIFDLEVTQPIVDLPLPGGTTGIAVLVRRKGVPVGFWMQRIEEMPRLDANWLANQVDARIGLSIIAAAIRDEVTPATPGIALPPTTIAICTKDRPDQLKRLLDCLHDYLPAWRKGNSEIEILIVDNAPSDSRTRELAESMSWAKYVIEPRTGLDFARNRAIQEARGEILAFLDDDTVPDKYWLAGLAEAWAANKDAAVFTGQVLPLELETEAQVIFEQRGGFRHGFERVRYGPVLPGDKLYPGGAGNFGTGANMAFQTGALREMGGFDEALDTGRPVPGGGDLDMFYRMIRAGHTLVYDPRFLAFHQHRRELKQLRHQYYRSWGFGFMCYISKCLKSDRERRTHLLRLLVWWFIDIGLHLLLNLKKGIQKKTHIPPHLLAGEIWGAVQGLMGGYVLSQRRVDRIRRRFAQ